MDVITGGAEPGKVNVALAPGGNGESVLHEPVEPETWHVHPAGAAGVVAEIPPVNFTET